MLDGLRAILANAISPKSIHGTAFAHRPGGSPPKRGTKELLAAYSTMPWLRAVVGKVGIATASATWKLFALRDQNGAAILSRNLQTANFVERKRIIKAHQQSGNLEQVDNHPLLELLTSGNSTFPGNAAFSVTQNHLDLVGEAFWIKERDGLGLPISINPIPPHWVRDLPSPDNAMFTLNIAGRVVEIAESDVIRFPMPEPVDPYGRGGGTARALGDELEADEFAARHVKNWFYNSARPDLLITADGLDKDETLRFEQRWLEKAQGLRNKWLPFFVNKDVKVKELSQTFENMQLTDLRKFERDTIIEVYGVPPEMLGVIESSNRATIDASEFLFTKWVVVPRLEFQRSVLQANLVPDFDPKLILDFDNPIAEDKVHALRVMRANAGAWSLDEWRDSVGDEKLDNERGRFFLRTRNQVEVPVDQDPEPPSEP